MISLGTLADALAPPLIEEPLKLDKTEVVERGAEQGPPPEPAEIPIVSIGRPRAWLTDNIPPSPGDGWAATSPAIHEDERVLLLRMACSFRPRSDRVKIVWARFTARLIGDNERLRAPIAVNLYPDSVEVERKVTRRVALSPSLTLMEVEVGLGEIGATVEYPAVEPIISAAGNDTDVLSWDFSESPGHAVRGAKLLMAVVVAPAEMRRLEVACGIQADLRYRGLRWPSWLGGADPRYEAAHRVVAWQQA